MVSLRYDHGNCFGRLTMWLFEHRTGVPGVGEVIHPDHNGRVDAIDPVRNLMHIRSGLFVRRNHEILVAAD